MVGKYFWLCLLSGCLWNCLARYSYAEIIPDDTLGNESSVVVPQSSTSDKPNGIASQRIEGGATRANNLFHSFSEFSIPDQSQVYFASPTGIDNIITRVTGSNLSDISGTLGTDGGTNLFLLNPNGIIFGQNSQLDLAGSFLATTADSYIFNNGFDYSASNPEAPPLLTVDIPVGLQFGSNVGAIVNRSRILPNEANLDATKSEPIIPEGLRSDRGQNLSLIGGKVVLEGGYLNTSQGKIELGGVGENSKVGLIARENNWDIDYTGVTEFADIRVNQQGGIDGGKTGGSQINLTGKNISFGYDLDTIAELGYEIEDFFSFESLPLLDELSPDKTQIVAHNLDNDISSQININAVDTFSIIDPGKEEKNFLTHTFGRGDAGNIEINSNTIIMYGASIESSTLAGATGDSGSINFVANNMSIQYGGGGVNTFSQGSGGLIHLDIEEDVKLQFGGFGAEVGDRGDGGTIQVETKDLEIRFGGFGSDSRGAGKGGRIQIDAEDLEIRFGGFGVSTFADGDGGTIDLNIANNLKVSQGGFGADTLAEGNGGSIEIDTQNLELINAGMGVNSRGTGQGGEINIKAESIVFKDGVIGAESGTNSDARNIDERGLQEKFNSRNAGDGGNISIEAQNMLIDGGNVTTSTVGTGNAGNINLQVDTFEAIGNLESDLPIGINSFTEGGGSGGTIFIDARDFKLSKEAVVTASSTDVGQAGDIRLDVAGLLELFDEGAIEVNGGMNGKPGNIEIQGQDIRLNRNSIISANTSQGTQGNISITGNNLFLRDRSKIITDASQDATGGNIFIDLKDNLIGFNNSQITASAEQGKGGNINVNTRGLFFSADSRIDASSDLGVDGLIEVNTLAIDPNSGLTQLPTEPIDPSLYLSQGCSSDRQYEFVSAGRGGLPANPIKEIAQNIFIPDLGNIDVDLESIPNLKSLTSISDRTNPIVEAQNWKVNQQGKVELIAHTNKTNIARDRTDCLK